MGWWGRWRLCVVRDAVPVSGCGLDPVVSAEWARVYRSESVRLMRLATLLVGSADAADLTMAAVAKAVRSAVWSTVSEPGAYLTRTLVNLARDRHRQSERRTRRETRASFEHRASVMPDAAQALQVRAALASLSPTQLAVIYLRFWEDLTTAAIGGVLGISEGAVLRHLHRAKNHLRPVLEDES